ncbi:hypothetical protein M408DRAFT_328946 [Serendipita vermifera MAFF 305830]|uniref:F-box domain-containing protein n=1 Tax=Serendipita vermifera MAFF 305830 TaxID=933852 RepID=A0A0C3BAZ8_SERVB|nr:hypothetical protein M408DRAFT_328946 [Serendipita vermifera MAFF 305830]
MPVDKFRVTVDSGEPRSNWGEREVPFPLSRLIVSHRKRITCLSVRGEELEKYTRKSFPNLTSLFVVDGDLLFTRDRFPQLAYLHAWYCELRPGPVGTQYPPLQYLSIHINEDSEDYLRVLQACSATLKGLDIRGHIFAEPPASVIEIQFPMLTYLSVDEFLASKRSNTSLPTLHAITSNLISYANLTITNSTVALHNSARSVQYLRAAIISDIAIYSSLRTLQLSLLDVDGDDSCVLPNIHPPRLYELFGILKDSKTCPLLESIDILEPMYINYTGRTAILAFQERIYDLRPLITVCTVKELSALPGSLELARCDAGMPCQRIPDEYV